MPWKWRKRSYDKYVSRYRVLALGLIIGGRKNMKPNWSKLVAILKVYWAWLIATLLMSLNIEGGSSSMFYDYYVWIEVGGGFELVHLGLFLALFFTIVRVWDMKNKEREKSGQ